MRWLFWCVFGCQFAGALYLIVTGPIRFALLLLLFIVTLQNILLWIVLGDREVREEPSDSTDSTAGGTKEP